MQERFLVSGKAGSVKKGHLLTNDSIHQDYL